MNNGPLPIPETQQFWDAAKEKKLVLQYCRDCRKPYFPPRPGCPGCGSRRTEILEASGKATLYSYVISHVGPPGWDTPFIMAIVELAEGPRMLSNIVGIEPDPKLLELDMPLQLCFRDINNELKLPVFRPETTKEIGS